MAAVFGFAQHFARLGQDRGRDVPRAIDGTFLGEEIEFVPVFPGFERLAADVPGKAHAKALLDMETYDLDAGPAGEVRAFLP